MTTPPVLFTRAASNTRAREVQEYADWIAKHLGVSPAAALDIAMRLDDLLDKPARAAVPARLLEVELAAAVQRRDELEVALQTRGREMDSVIVALGLSATATNTEIVDQIRSIDRLRTTGAIDGNLFRARTALTKKLGFTSEVTLSGLLTTALDKITSLESLREEGNVPDELVRRLRDALGETVGRHGPALVELAIRRINKFDTLKETMTAEYTEALTAQGKTHRVEVERLVEALGAMSKAATDAIQAIRGDENQQRDAAILNQLKRSAGLTDLPDRRTIEDAIDYATRVIDAQPSPMKQAIAEIRALEEGVRT